MSLQVKEASKIGSHQIKPARNGWFFLLNNLIYCIITDEILLRKSLCVTILSLGVIFMRKSSRLLKLLSIAFFVAVVARLYVSFFVDGFIITFTAVVLATVLYFDDDINPIHFGVAVAVISPGLRILVDSVVLGSNGLLTLVYPDIFFYLTYGLVFYWIKEKLGKDYKSKFYIVVFFADLLSNFVELLIRTKVFNLTIVMVEGIVLVAIIRTIFTMLFIFVVLRYTSLLVKKEHEKRYDFLMHQTSRFKSEIYFLHKNMHQIEDLVALSHTIKREATKSNELKELALDLSKGVHEIKKDYIRAIRGLEEIYQDDLNLYQISLKELVEILEANTIDHLRIRQSKVISTFSCEVDLMVKEHFYLMSVLRNLINNGIEACGDEGVVDVKIVKQDNMIIITVSDSGVGIKEEDREFIFNTGYSTKFDSSSGRIARGIGLSLVKEMVNDIFKGEISYQSTFGEGTTFEIKINENVFKEDL